MKKDFFKKVLAGTVAGFLSLSFVSPLVSLAEETQAPTESPVTTTVPELTETTVTETPTPSEVPAESAESTSTPVPSTTPEVIETPSDQVESGTNSVINDVDDPVIEGVELINNGEEFTTDDTVRINVYAYDADSGISSVTVNLSSVNSGTYREIFLEKGTEENQYFTEIALTDYLPGEYAITGGSVVDYNTNSSAFNNLYDSTGSGSQYIYHFVVVDDTLDTNVKSFSFDENKIVLDSTANFNDFQMSLEMNTAFGANAYIELTFTASGDINAPYRVFRLDSTDGEGKVFGHPTSSYSYGPTTDGKYNFTLSNVRLKRDIGSVDLSMSNMDGYGYVWNYSAEEYEESAFDATVSSVELSHQGEFVTAGDVIDITVYVEANRPLSDTATIQFNSAKYNISPNSHALTLYYDEEKGAYTGQWTIEENRYSCEWYVYGVNLNAKDYSGWKYVYAPYNYPDYVKVKIGNSYSDPVQDVTATVYAFDAASWGWIPVETEKVSNIGRRTTLDELGITLPELNSPIEGMNPTGWADDKGYAITEESEFFVNYSYVGIYAQYDKLPYTISYNYYDASGNLKSEEKDALTVPGTTYGDLKEQLYSYVPADMTTEYDFTGWLDQNEYYADDTEVSSTIATYLSTTALYSDAKLICVYDQYYDETGLNFDGYASSVPGKAIMVDPSATYEDVLAEVEKLPQPKMYPGMVFDHWNVNPYDTGDFGPGSTINRNAVYQNGLVRTLLYKGNIANKQLVYSSLEVVDAGETYTIPDKFGNYNVNDIHWDINPGYENGTFTVSTEYGQNDIVGVVDKVIEDILPVDPSKPNIPAVRPDDGTVNNTINEIVNADAGETITVPMGNATVLPREVLEAAKGKDVTIVLQMNGYTWTINGKDIVATTLNDINMGVMIDSGAIPAGVVSELAGNNPTRQLSLAHEGDFGFRANLTINVGAENAGKVGNLFYYNSDNRMIFMSDPTVAADGSVTFPFSHASNYVIVLADESMRPASDKEETGVYDSPVPYAAAIIVSVAVAGYILKKRFVA